MQLNILAAVLATITAVSAAPASAEITEVIPFSSIANTEAPATLEKRAPSVAVKICENDNGGGYCEAGPCEANVGKCYSLSGSRLNDQVTSIYLYPTGFRCRFYEWSNCSGGNADYYSGSTNNVGKTWNDRFSSWQCFTT